METKDRKVGHHAHHVEASSMRCSRSRSRSIDSSTKEVKRVQVSSPTRALPHSSSSSDLVENYHIGEVETPANVCPEEPSQWERKPSAIASASTQCISTVVPTPMEKDDGWTRKPPRESLHPQGEHVSLTTVDPHAMMLLRQATPIIIPYEDRHRTDKPQWYHEAS
jgi:hypothetical protein